MSRQVWRLVGTPPAFSICRGGCACRRAPQYPARCVEPQAWVDLHRAYLLAAQRLAFDRGWDGYGWDEALRRLERMLDIYARTG
ncbi:MAG TPA: hypothetical protein VFC19_51195 [Candidatus Limnocylindrales bacterium]|nr:hypothetical protein [Candidatus Limnocylindrales bacterium]